MTLPKGSGDFATKIAADRAGPGTDKSAIDLEAWAAEFAVTTSQISDAVDAVGGNKADVEMYLKGSHSSTDGDTTRQGG